MVIIRWVRAQLTSHRWRTGIAGLLAVPPVAWAVARLAGLEPGFPGVALIAFTPYATAAFVLLLVAILLLRQWLLAAPVVLAIACLTVLVLPREVGRPDPERPGPALRVLSANLRIGGADPVSLVDLVRAGRVDLLALQEFTPAARERLTDAGLDELLPYQASYPLDGVGGSALYSRFPLSGGGYRPLPPVFGQAYATLRVPGAVPVPVESAHPPAPANAYGIPFWRAGLATEPAATPHGPVRLLLGDFNATLDHPELHRLLGTGYRDAADVVGAGWTPTWPYDGKPLPRVALDHVLVDPRIAVRAFAVHPLPNSDHRAVFASLVLPPA